MRISLALALLGVLLCPRLSSAQRPVVSAVADCRDSVVLLHEQEAICNFHIVSDATDLDFSIQSFGNFQITSPAKYAFVVTANADQIGHYKIEAGGYAFHHGETWQGNYAGFGVPVSWTVATDTCVHFRPSSSSLTLLPDIATKSTHGIASISLINNTTDTTFVRSLRLVGIDSAFRSNSITIAGQPVRPFAINPGDTINVVVEIQRDLRAYSLARCNTLTLLAEVNRSSVDTTIEATIYWQALPASLRRMTVNSGSPVRLYGVPRKKTSFLIEISKDSNTRMQPITGLPSWLTLDSVLERDTSISLWLSAYSGNGQILHTLNVVTCTTDDYFGRKLSDSVVLDIGFFAVDTNKERLWGVNPLPATPVRKSFNPYSDGSYSVCLDSGYAVSMDQGQNWTFHAGPARKMKRAVLLSSSLVFTLSDDSILYRSTDKGASWNYLNDTLGAYRIFGRPIGPTPLRIRQLYSCQDGAGVVAIAYYYVQYGAYIFDRCRLSLSSRDGFAWGGGSYEWAEDEFATAWVVDSDFYLRSFVNQDLNWRSDERAGPVSVLDAQYRELGILLGLDKFGLYYLYDSVPLPSLMLGSVPSVAVGSQYRYFATNGTAVYALRSLDSGWEVILTADSAEPIRQISLDADEHLIALSDRRLFRSQSPFRAVPPLPTIASGLVVSIDVRPGSTSMVCVAAKGDCEPERAVVYDPLGREIATITRWTHEPNAWVAPLPHLLPNQVAFVVVGVDGRTTACRIH